MSKWRIYSETYPNYCEGVRLWYVDTPRRHLAAGPFPKSAMAFRAFRILTEEKS